MIPFLADLIGLKEIAKERIMENTQMEAARDKFVEKQVNADNQFMNGHIQYDYSREYATSFEAGYAARDAEVERLKEALKRLAMITAAQDESPVVLWGRVVYMAGVASDALGEQK